MAVGSNPLRCMSPGVSTGAQQKGSARERDVVPLLPLPPRPCGGGDLTQRGRRNLRVQLKIWLRTCESIAGLKQLFRGRLNEEDFVDLEDRVLGRKALSVEWGVCWGKASEELRGLVKRLEGAWGRQRPAASEPHGEAALQRLNLIEAGSGCGPSPGDNQGIGRGSVFPATISAIALPIGVRRPVRASLLSPRAAEVFCDAHTGRCCGTRRRRS